MPSLVDRIGFPDFQLLTDSIPALIHTSLPDGYLDYFNRRWLEYVGVPLEEVEGWKWTGCIHPDDVAGIVERWRACLASGEIFEYEARVRRADGQYRWMSHTKIPLRDERGQIVKWYGSSIDIEERKKTEFYLAEAQRLAHMGSWAFNPAGFDYWSSELFQIYGLDAKGKPPTVEEYFRLIHPEDREFVVQEIQKMLADNAGFDFTKRIVRPDGKVRHVRCVGVPASRGSAFQEFVGTGIDLTEQEQLTEELRKSERYLAEAQALSHMGSWVWQMAGREAVHLSDEWYRLYEFDPKEGIPTWEERLKRVHPEDRDTWQGTIERAIRDKSDYDVQFRILLSDGTLKWIHTVGHPVLSAAGELIQFVGTSMDITERKRAEDRIRLVINTVPGLLWSARPDGWVDFINQRWLDYTGMTLEQALGWGWVPAFHPDELDQVLIKWRAAVAEGKPLEIETRLRRFDGEYRWFLERVFPLFDRTGNILGWYGSDIDIHERKLAEEKIREQEIELRQMLDLAPQLILVFGPARERIYANHTALDYLGISLEKWRQTPDMGEFVHPDDRAQVRSFYYSALSSGTAYELEYRVRKGDGSYRWFLTRYNPLRDDQGGITRWYCAFTDIEDRKRAEEKLQQENIALREEVDQTSMFEEIIGTSPALQAVLRRVSKVAPSDSTVLVTGETGTGKELIARAIHRRSRRMSRPFVSVNCAAIPRDLIASELFGHEKGAFTGATQRRLGRFELADGGTIFLDEVGELLPDTQVALLRVLQERELERLGGRQPIRVDVRVIAATNRDLTAAVASGTFRQDLFYRLNVFPIEVPALRERKDDILMLVEYFVQRYTSRAGKNIHSIDKKTLDLLQCYDWPGNIRELQNVIERSVILSSGEVFSVDELWLSQETSRPASRVKEPQPVNGRSEPRSEREIIEAALAETRGRVSGPSGAAAKLRIPPSTLDHRIKALKINKKKFKFL
ncbi:MAG TPA: PAS domain-containing protein [Terriglobales bacterium]|nr:PAS domain-containing protein [Terriglobales bacterium]